MLNGEFKNCYGIKSMSLNEINFSYSSGVIYAPNGVMKTSLTKVFKDIQLGELTTDRIYKGLKSSYNIKYKSTKYENVKKEPCSNIYVIESFLEKFDFNNSNIDTVLADEKTRKEYDLIMDKYKVTIDALENGLFKFSGVPKKDIKETLAKDFKLNDPYDWPDIINALWDIYNDIEPQDYLSKVKYNHIINGKTISILTNTEFMSIIEEYISTINALICDNKVLSKGFNDYNATDLGSSLKKNNIFEAEHKIVLKDGLKEITNLNEWNVMIKKEIDKIYEDNLLKSKFEKLKKKLDANIDSRIFKDILMSNKEIIYLLNDIDKLKIKFWRTYLEKLPIKFKQVKEETDKFADEIKELYKTAEIQSEKWTTVVTEFNNRFKVPYYAEVENKANYILKDEAPRIKFKFTGNPEEEETELEKEDLIKYLSMGEKRALYLLYILFDLENIKQKAVEDSHNHLIIVDDIADSFDYKNKYAIIQYLCEISEDERIDLLMLTHNFDFYRTVVSRMDLHRKNCFIAEKTEDTTIKIHEYKYRNDFFKKTILEPLNSKKTLEEDRFIKFIASIPFFRNMCDYMPGFDAKKNYLTSLLHLKNIEDSKTENLSIKEVLALIPNQFINENKYFKDCDDNYLDKMFEIAENISNDKSERLALDNKIFLSISIRLKTEIYLKEELNQIGLFCEEKGSQTRKLTEKYITNCNPPEGIVKVLDEVNIMTNEAIHINSFMYEPLIDMSDWFLKKLYTNVCELN